MDGTKSCLHRQFAKVKTLADDHATPMDASTEIDQTILLRIRKCLDRANHPNTPEAEAQAALRMSSRLMQQHNINHSDMVATECATSEPSKLSGQSIVSILHKDPGKKIIYETWVDQIAYAITIFFDCKDYSTQSLRCVDWTFYGIAINTVAAAMAFEMVHNLIQDWSMRKRKGNKNSYRLGVANGLRVTARKEKDEEENRAHEQEAADLVAKEQKEQEQRQRELDRLLHNTTTQSTENNVNIDDANSSTDTDGSVKAIKRESVHVKIEDDVEEFNWQDNLNLESTAFEHKHTPGSYDDDDFRDLESIVASNSALDSEHDDFDSDSDLGDPTSTFLPTFDEEKEVPVDIEADFEDELRHHMPQGIKKEDPEEDFEKVKVETTSDFDTLKHESDKLSGLTEWKSAGALILFRQNAQKIAEDYLKANDVKLSKGRKRDYKVRDWDAYHDGVKDSKKIDVKRRRIEGSKDIVMQE